MFSLTGCVKTFIVANRKWDNFVESKIIVLVSISWSSSEKMKFIIEYVLYLQCKHCHPRTHAYID